MINEFEFIFQINVVLNFQLITPPSYHKNTHTHTKRCQPI